MDERLRELEERRKRQATHTEIVISMDCGTFVTPFRVAVFCDAPNDLLEDRQHIKADFLDKLTAALHKAMNGQAEIKLRFSKSTEVKL